MRFACADLTGDDDLLEEAADAQTIKDAVQSSVEVGHNEKPVMGVQYLQCWKCVLKQFPRARTGIVLVEFVENLWNNMRRKTFSNDFQKRQAHKLPPPCAVVVSGWFSFRVQRGRGGPPCRTEGCVQECGIGLHTVLRRHSGIGLADRFMEFKQRSCGIKEDRTNASHLMNVVMSHGIALIKAQTVGIRIS